MIPEGYPLRRGTLWEAGLSVPMDQVDEEV